MYEVGHLDVLLYGILASAVIIQTNGLSTFLDVFITQLAPFLFWEWPYAIYSNRVLTRVGSWTSLNLRVSDFEYSTIRLLRFFMERVTPTSPLLSFRSAWALEWTHRIRGFMRKGGFEEVDIQYAKIQEGRVKGLWVYSNSARTQYGDYDFIQYYIPGGGFMVGSAYLYLEFMQVYTLALLEQGFVNPAVFIPELVLLPEQGYEGQLQQVVQGWAYLGKNYPRSALVIGGDSTGGTLAMGLMMTIATAEPVAEATERRPETPVVETAKASSVKALGVGTQHVVLKEGTPITSPHENRQGSANAILTSRINAVAAPPLLAESSALFPLRRPSAAMLISPIITFAPFVSASRLSTNEDFLTPTILNRWNGFCKPSGTLLSTERFDEALWCRAFPSVGMVITYGANELLAESIVKFSRRLLVCGRLKTIKIAGSVHAGPVMTFYTERTLEERELYVHVLAGNMARMMLWNTEGFLNYGDGGPHPAI